MGVRMVIWRLRLGDMQDSCIKCKFCGDDAGYRMEVCPTHEMIACVECGRKAIWRSRLGKYVCMDLDCDWGSEELPNYRGCAE
jgi:hypothetical protein